MGIVRRISARADIALLLVMRHPGMI